ncbi:hypothetical protein BMF94_1377 [Rhodotorula taiwanensis]|uniref:Uncharacterized protein n=1 Tax=Rhodotorula taiwanensis TaxID=741276 RepID=A0A2S5BFD0_9BASI|nr:hypothetical protein BMF94_1377 [Rhodotorula taiwanensis]
MFRAAARTSFRQSRQTFARRSYATGHHTSTTPQKSDMPWVIGSALVFIPLFFTLTSPPGVHAQVQATSPHKEEHQADVPAVRKATLAEDPKDKESSPEHAAKAEAEKSSEDETDVKGNELDTKLSKEDKPKNVAVAAKESVQNTLDKPAEETEAKADEAKEEASC